MTLALKSPNWRYPSRRWQGEAFGAVRNHLLGASPVPAVVSAIMGAGKSLLIEELCAAARLRRNEIIVVSTSTQHLVEDLADAIRQRTGTCGYWYGRRKMLGRVVVSCYDSTIQLAKKLERAGKRVALWIADECHRTECETVLRAYEQLAPAHAIGMTATPFRTDAQWESISLFGTLLYRYTAAQAQADNVVVPWRIVHSETGGELDDVCLEMIRSAEGPGLANAVNIADAEAFAKHLTTSGITSEAVHSRQRRQTQRQIIQRLKGGNLRCVVHVNMLSEGANFPWLRWLCLRREVESRVRFVQEVGRLLRVAPGKTEAIFYDPHDLFGTFSLAYAEALGEAPEKPEWEGIVPEPEEIAERILDADEAVAIAWIESVVRTLVVAAETAGFPLRRKIIKKAERLAPSTLLQHIAMQEQIGDLNGTIPGDWKRCLQQIIDRPECVRFGFAADLLTLFQAVEDTGNWPDIQTRIRHVKLIGDGQLQFAGCHETSQPVTAIDGRT